MLGANQIYEHMSGVSQRYSKLKSLFQDFSKLAEAVLSEKNCPVKNVEFFPDLENDRIYVRFSGRDVLFSFAADLAVTGSGRGIVKCKLVDSTKKIIRADVCTFSFNGQGDTELSLPPDGDIIAVHEEAGAAYLVLHVLNEALGK